MNNLKYGLVMLIGIVFISFTLTLEKIYQEKLNLKSANNDYFKFSRNKNEFNVHIKINNNCIKVYDSYNLIYESTKDNFLKFLETLNTKDASEDALLFLNKIKALINSEKSFILTEIPKINAIALKFYKFSPSHIFYFNNNQNIYKAETFEQKITFCVQNIHNKPETCRKRKILAALMGLYGYFNHFFISLTHNSIVFYQGEKIKMCIFIKYEKILQIFKDIPIFKNLIIPLQRSSLCFYLTDNTIKIQVPDREFPIIANFVLNKTFYTMRDNLLKHKFIKMSKSSLNQLINFIKDENSTNYDMNILEVEEKCIRNCYLEGFKCMKKEAEKFYRIL